MEYEKRVSAMLQLPAASVREPGKNRYRKIYLYAAGLMGKAILQLLMEKGIYIEAILDKNHNLHGTRIDGVPVCDPEAVPREMRENSLVLVSFVRRPFAEMKAYLHGLGYTDVLFGGDFCAPLYSAAPLANIWWADALSEKEKTKIGRTVSSFREERSKREYWQAFQWFYFHEACKDRNFEISKEDRYFIPEVLAKVPSHDAVFVDSGYLNGEYVKEIVRLTDGQYKHIYSFVLQPEKAEPSKNEKISVINQEIGGRSGTEKVIRIGTMQPYQSEEPDLIQMVTLNEFQKDEHIDYIRFYNISPVLPAIQGAIERITRDRPVLAVNIGHYRSDFIEIPILLNEYLEGYAFLFRAHNFYGNDSILYAIPEE